MLKDLKRHIPKAYLQALLTIALMVCIFGFLLDYKAVVFSPMYYARCIMDGSIFALPVLLVGARFKKITAIIICTFLALFFEANVLYFRAFEDLISIDDLKLSANIGELVLRDALYYIKAIDILLFLPIVLSLFTPNKKSTKRLLFALTILLCNALFIFAEYEITIITLKAQNRTAYNRYTTKGKWEINDAEKDYMLCNGAFPYLCAYFAYEGLSNNNSILFDYKAIDTSVLATYKDDNHAYCKGKNLVILFAESFDKLVVNYKINGKEICPIFNAIYNDSTSISTSFRAQDQAGMSSDAHLMVNTGLIPMKKTVTAYSINDNIPSLVKALPWKRAFVVTTDFRCLWNQYKTNQYFGYKENYYDVVIQNEINCNKTSDKEVFDYGSNIISQSKEPFIAQFVTLSMHEPFHYVSDKNDWIMEADSLDIDVRRYLNCAHYFDKCLGEFLQALKDNGKYDNTVIAIMGDHCVPNKEFGLKSGYCPIVILNSGCPKELIPHPQNMQQIDIYPTLLDLMGGNKYGWKGLGHSIFRSDKPNDEEALFKLSEQLILSDYFKHQKY